RDHHLRLMGDPARPDSAVLQRVAGAGSPRVRPAPPGGSARAGARRDHAGGGHQDGRFRAGDVREHGVELRAVPGLGLPRQPLAFQLLPKQQTLAGFGYRSPVEWGDMVRELAFINLFRSIAAFWVLAAHCMIWGGWYGLPLPSAKIAVDLFMMISGFLMASNALARGSIEPLGSLRSWLRFWLRRFFRLAPAYYVS